MTNSLLQKDFIAPDNATFIFIAQSLRYFVIAGIPFLIFYVWKKRDRLNKKIQNKFPEGKDYAREIIYSVITFIIFTMAGMFIVWSIHHGYSLFYEDLHAHNTAYFILSIVLMIFLHDTYFYWTHRLMHTKLLFPVFHKVHHLSNNPSPWAAFAFHPLEAIIEAAILPLIAFTIPWHPLALFIFIIYMTLMNVLGHLGFELFPHGFTKHWLWKWHNTSTHHNMHHRFVKCNYGLYFNIWDKLMGTNHETYHEHFEEVAALRKKQE